MERQASEIKPRRLKARIQYELKSIEIGRRYFYKILESLEPSYIKTPVNTNVVDGLIMYAHGYPSNILGKEIDPCKAIGIVGNTGSGKTIIMQALQQYMMIDEVKCIFGERIVPFYPKRFISLTSLQGIYETKGWDGLEPYFYGVNIVVDEVKDEQLWSKHYGNSCNVFATLIEERYIKGGLTSFTSNLNMQQIASSYNDRIYSRIMEKSNIIELVENDWRLVQKPHVN